MPTKQSQTQEVNSFVQGLITEATLLDFPVNASSDELNFSLNKDGSRNRRLGMVLEDGGVLVDTLVIPENLETLAMKVYKWENVGGDAAVDVAVVQIGGTLKFHPLSMNTASASEAFPSYTFDLAIDYKLDFTSVDGKLVVPTKDGSVTVFTPEDDGSLRPETGRLKIRDLTGVTDTYRSDFNPDTSAFDGKDLLEQEYLSVRPAAADPLLILQDPILSDAHLYNLRNQTWAKAVEEVDSRGGPQDPVAVFRNRVQAYPSNADNFNVGLQTDSTDEKLPVRFQPQAVQDANFGNTRAPVGYFILDALNRGASRQEQLSILYQKDRDLSVLPEYSLGFPEDRTPSGATSVAEYAGHVFYAGFEGSTVGADTHSLGLSNVVMFSQLVKATSDIYACYQEGDPTSEESFDVVATDGGYIRIAEAYGIVRLIPLGNALLVVATNGVWSVSGGSDFGFDATNYLITKISSRGAVSSESVVVLDEQAAYWAEDGIYIINADELGGYKAQNITARTIQRYYDGISSPDKADAFGGYDTFSRQIRWVYGGDKELVFDIELGAFYPAEYPSNFESGRVLVGYAETPPFLLGTLGEIVTVGSEIVTSDGDNVTVDKVIRQVAQRSLKYLFQDTTGEVMRYSFSVLQGQRFEDWEDLGGFDAKAYLLTGAITGGDTGKSKQAPYLTTHFRATETGFDEDYNLVNEGSCLVRSQWNWTNSISGNKWGRPFQAYRKKRVYFPDDDLILDDGEAVVTTKNKLRGRGRAVSIYMESEPLKDLQLLGWSLNINGNAVT